MQVGASSAGVARALTAALQSVSDLSCYEFKQAPREDGQAPSQGWWWDRGHEQGLQGAQSAYLLD